MAFGALRAAHDLGIRVPEQLSFVSLHDSELANYSIPPLTTVVMPTRELGAAAVDLLLEQMEGGEARSILVPGEGHLEQRQSVAPPAGARGKPVVDRHPSTRSR